MNIGYGSCMMNTCKERKKLLNEIGKVDFILTELNLYLDTHPYDQQAMDKFQNFNMMKSQLVREYTEKYGPIIRSCMDMDNKEWKWATQDWPWEGGYY